MKVADLIYRKDNGLYESDTLLCGDLIALDGKTGKVLFDTLRNKKEYIKQFREGEVISLWADVRHCKGIAYADYFKPVMKCYVSHNSWESEGEE